MKWFVLILSFSLWCLELSSQSDYYELQARSHQSDATYYVKQAQGYDRDAEYSMREAAVHLRDAEYYQRQKNMNRHGVRYVKHEMQLRELMTISGRRTMPVQMPSHILDVLKMLYKMQKSKRVWLHVNPHGHKQINNQ